jgi:hypothetical protein
MFGEGIAHIKSGWTRIPLTLLFSGPVILIFMAIGIAEALNVFVLPCIKGPKK